MIAVLWLTRRLDTYRDRRAERRYHWTSNTLADLVGRDRRYR